MMQENQLKFNNSEPYIKNISPKELDTELSDKDSVIILDFWAEWCFPCKKIEPILVELVQKYPKKVKLLKINVDDYPELATRFGVLGIPTVIFFHNGEEFHRLIGARPKQDYVRKLEECL